MVQSLVTVAKLKHALTAILRLTRQVYIVFQHALKYTIRLDVAYKQEWPTQLRTRGVYIVIGPFL
jgi:hypothetical protein